MIFLLPALIGLLSLPRPAYAQIGTALTNISSDSQQMTYVSTWRSDTSIGIYEAYSNATDAEVTFSFLGVAASYVVVKKADRGLCLLKVDNDAAYTVDLYDDSGFTQSQTVIWTSPTLPYGAHNVTVSQIGVDARIGFYPYLYTETWIEAVPTNVASYTATQVHTTATTGALTAPTGGSSGSSSSSTNLAPIVGGAVGGVIACFLLGFLIYLWRKDKKRNERGGRMIQKVKKAEGKMAIDDDQNPGNYGAAGRPWSGDHSASDGNGSYPATYYSGENGSYGYGQSLPYPATSPNFASGMYGSRPTSYAPVSPYQDHLTPAPRPQGAYPYHTQGQGEDTRSYPVPEI